MNKKDVENFVKEGAEFNPNAQERYKALRARRTPELELHQKWVAGGMKKDDPHLEQLLESLDPMIQRAATTRIQGLGGKIPLATMKAELQRHTVRALETYDPSKAALSTHIHNNFQRVTDWEAANRNTRKMDKKLVSKYQEYQNMKADYENRHGMQPSPAEIATALKMPLHKVHEMERGFAPEVFHSISPVSDDHAAENSIRTSFLMVRGSLSPKAKEFGELYFPPTGQRQMEVAAIAKALGVPEHKAYRLKAEVEKKMAPLVKGR